MAEFFKNLIYACAIRETFPGKIECAHNVFIPERELVTDQSNNCTHVQLDELVSFCSGFLVNRPNNEGFLIQE